MTEIGNRFSPSGRAFIDLTAIQAGREYRPSPVSKRPRAAACSESHFQNRPMAHFVLRSMDLPFTRPSPRSVQVSLEGGRSVHDSLQFFQNMIAIPAAAVGVADNSNT
jgi:hypothetical protein